MAPGILFLAGSGPPVPGSDEATNQETRPRSEQGSAMSSPGSNSGRTNGSGKKVDPSNRPDSPGYFTLSDSDGSSNPGTESPHDEEEHHHHLLRHSRVQGQASGHHVYKMFKSPGVRNSTPGAITSPRRSSSGNAGMNSRQAIQQQRSKSETPPRLSAKGRTPPRPSPPKTYKSRDPTHDPLPPRPPPPLNYTATLPPPVPKKTRTSSGPKQVNSKTLPMRRNSMNSQQQRPLQRVQPLQIQSPSIVKVLTNGSCAEKTSSSTNKAATDGKKPKQTFVSAFQKANDEIRKGTTVKTRVSPPKSTSPRSSSTKTSSNSPRNSTSKSNSPRSSSHSSPRTSPRTSPAKEITSSSLRKAAAANLRSSTSSLSSDASSSKTPRPRSGSHSCVNRTTTVNNSNPLKKTTESVKRSLQNISKKTANQANKGKGQQQAQVKSTTAKKVTSHSKTEPLKTVNNSGTNNVNLPKRSAKSLSSTCIDKIKAKSASVDKRINEMRKERAEKRKREQNESKPKDPETEGVFIVESARTPEGEKKPEKPNSPTNSNMKTMMFPNPIHTLIKYYENEKPECLKKESSPVVLRDPVGNSSSSDKRLSDPSVTSSRISGHLSQLSHLSAEQLNSWLANPTMPSLESKDLSITEIDVLDQYVTDMITFTQDALPNVAAPTRTSWGPTSDAFLSILEMHKHSSDENVRQSVQDIITKIETNNAKIAEEAEVEKRRRKSKSEEPQSTSCGDHGVFTEVSFAGSFSHSSATPSPQPPSRVSNRPKTPISPTNVIHSANSPTPPPRLRSPTPPKRTKSPAMRSPTPPIRVKSPSRNAFTPEPSSKEKPVDPLIQTVSNNVMTPEKVNTVVVTDTMLRAPKPSPRTKKKARKEQMLQEHKEKGREALNHLLKSKSLGNVPNNRESDSMPSLGKESFNNRECILVSNEVKKSNSNSCLSGSSSPNGLQCLEELCVQSQTILRGEGRVNEATEALPLVSEESRENQSGTCADNKDVKEQQSDSVKVRQSSLLSRIGNCLGYYATVE